MIEKISIEKFKDGKLRKEEDVVIKEKEIEIYVNNNFLLSTACIKKNLKEMALGNLISKGERFSLENYYEEGDKVYLTIKKTLIKRKVFPISLSSEMIMKASRENLKASQLFKETGMIHCCSIYKGEELVSFGEDLGRHNAIDKAVGKAFLKGICLEECFLVTSGRMPFDIVAKCINSGVQAIISRSAPSLKGLQLAKEHKITLIGFARGDGFNIYNRSIDII